MAKLEDASFRRTGLMFKLQLYQSSYYKDDFNWVGVKLDIKSNRFPDIEINNEFQEIFEIEYLIASLKSLIEGKINIFDYEPVEPEYRLVFRHSGRGMFEKEDVFFASITLDAGGSGRQTGSGLTVGFRTNSFGLKKMKGGLERELREIKREIQIQKGEYIANSVPYKERN